MHGLRQKPKGLKSLCRLYHPLVYNILQNSRTYQTATHSLEADMMANTDYSKWSQEKLVSRITELENKLRNQNVNEAS